MRTGSRAVTDNLLFFFRKTNGHPRFAVVVSTKVDKRAVVRNRIRRIVSESARHLLAHVSSVDGIFVARKNIAEFSQENVEKIVKDLLSKATIL